MKILVFDTETTGFPQPGAPLASQPYIVQFGALQLRADFANRTFEEIRRVDQLLSVPVPVPAECTAVHGITNEMLTGQPSLREFLDEFLELFGSSDIAVAHNLNFDRAIIEGELARLGRGAKFLPAETFDTMESTTELCQIPNGRGGYKYPTLTALHRFLFGTDFAGAHNAMHDVEATARIAEELWKRDIFQIREKQQASLF